MAFNLVAQLQIQAPTDFGRVISQIRGQLKNISANVDLKINPTSAANIKALSQQTVKLTQELRNLTTAANQAGLAIAGIGRQGNISSTASSIARSINSISVSANNVTKSVGDAQNGIEEFGRAAGLAGRRFLGFSLVAGTIVGSLNAVKNAFAEALKFEREFVKISQVGRATKQELSELNSEITRLSTSLGVSSKDLLATSITLRQAGLSVKEVTSAMEVLAKTTLAPTFDNIKDTTEGAIAIMAQFRIESKELEKALGSANAVAAAFAVESKDIIVAVQRAGGAFKSVGGDLDEFIALFTSVRQTTRESAESIATGLRTIFTRLQRKDTVEALRDLGVNLRYTRQEAEALGQTDLENQFVGAYESVRRLSEALSKIRTTDPRYSEVIEQLGGYRQISKVIPLIQQFTVSQKALTIAQAGFNSVTTASEEAQKTFLVRLAKIKEEFLNLARVITNSQAFQGFLDTSLKLARAFTSIGEALSPVIPLLTTLATVRLASSLTSFFSGTRQGFAGVGPKHLATGGVVPGSGNGDTVPAMLTPGEFVIRKSSAQAIGYDKLSHINKYATGGIVKNATVGNYNLSPNNIKWLFALANRKDGGKALIEKNQDKLVGLFGAPKNSSGKYENANDVFAALGFTQNSRNGNVQTLTELRKILTENKDFINERRNLAEKGKYVKNGKLIVPFFGETIGMITTGLTDGNEGKTGRGALNAGLRVVSSDANVLGKKTNQTSQALLKQAGVKEIQGGVNVHILNAQPTYDFSEKILGKIQSNIEQIFTNEFGGARVKPLDRAKIASLSGHMFEKYVEGISGRFTAGNEEAFEYVKTKPGSTLGKAFDNFVFPGPVKENFIDLKNVYNRGNVNDLLKKYLNVKSRDGGLARSLGIGLKSDKTYAPLPAESTPTKPTKPGRELKFATGGVVPGTGNGDTVPAMLTPGEFVIRKSSAKAIGYDKLAHLNTGGQARPFVLNNDAVQKAFAELQEQYGIDFSRGSKLVKTSNFGETSQYSTARGFYSPKTKGIYLNSKYITDEKTLKEVLVHESIHGFDNLFAEKRTSRPNPYGFDSGTPGTVFSKTARSLREVSYGLINSADKAGTPYSDEMKKYISSKEESLATHLGRYLASGKNFRALAAPNEIEALKDKSNLKEFLSARNSVQQRITQTEKLLKLLRRTPNLRFAKGGAVVDIGNPNDYAGLFLDKPSKGGASTSGAVTYPFEKISVKDANKVYSSVNRNNIRADLGLSPNTATSIQLTTGGKKGYKLRDKDLGKPYATEVPIILRGKPGVHLLDNKKSVKFKDAVKDKIKDAAELATTELLDGTGIPSALAAKKSRNTILSIGERGILGYLYESALVSATNSAQQIASRSANDRFDIVSPDKAKLAQLFNPGPTANFLDVKAGLNNANKSSLVAKATSEVGSGITAKYDGSSSNLTDVISEFKKEKASFNRQRVKLGLPRYALGGPVQYFASGGEVPSSSRLKKYVGKILNKDTLLELVSTLGLAVAGPDAGDFLEKKYREDVSRGKEVAKFSSASRLRTKFALGGFAKGQDTVPAMLTPGEFVINRSAASRIGLANLNYMNQTGKVRGYNKGGVVQYFETGGKAEPIEITGKLNLAKIESIIVNLEKKLKSSEKGKGTFTKVDDFNLKFFENLREKFNNLSKAAGVAEKQLKVVVKTDEKGKADIKAFYKEVGEGKDKKGVILNDVGEEVARKKKRGFSLDQLAANYIKDDPAYIKAQQEFNAANNANNLYKQTKGKEGTRISEATLSALANKRQELLSKIPEEKQVITKELVDNEAARLRKKGIDKNEAYLLAQENVTKALLVQRKVIVDETTGTAKLYKTTDLTEKELAKLNTIRNNNGGSLITPQVAGLNALTAPGPRSRLERLQDFGGKARSYIGEKFGQVSLLGTTLGASYGSQLFENKQQDFNTAATTGYTTRVTLNAGLSGALTGAAAGGAIGSVFTPMGAVVGAAAGALYGFNDSVKAAEREIRSAKIGQALTELSDIINRVNKKDSLTGSDRENIVETINTIRENISKNAIQESTSFFGGFDGKKYQDIVAKEGRASIGKELPLLYEILNREAVNLGKNFAKTSKEFEGLSFDEVQKRVADLDKGFIEANRSILEIIAQEKKVSVEDLVASDFKRAKIQGFNDSRRQDLSERATINLGQQLGSFNRLSSAIDRAAKSIEVLDAKTINLNDAFEGTITNTLRVAEINGLSSSEEVGGFGSVLGKSGRDLEVFTNDFLRIKDVLGSVLPDVLAQPSLDSKDIGISIKEAIQSALGKGATSTPAAEAIINSIGKNANEQGLSELKISSKANIKQLIDKLTAEANPLDLTNDIQRRFGDAANKFIDGLIKYQGRISRIGEQEDKLRQIQLVRIRFINDRLAEVNGQRNGALDKLSVETLNAPITKRAERLTGLGDNADSVDAIVGKLRDLDVAIAAATQEQQRAFNTNKLSSQEGQAAAARLADLKRQSGDLQVALKDLTDVSTRNAAAQEKLNRIQEDRASRLSFGEKFLRADASGRSEINRGIRLTELAARQGSLKGFSSRNINAVLDTLSSLGNAKVNFGGVNQRASDLRQNLINNTYPGLFDVSQESKKEEEKLNDMIGSNLAKAEEAQDRFIEFQRENNDYFLKELLSIQKAFFSSLQANLTKELISREEQKVSGLTQERGDLQVKEKAGKTIAEFFGVGTNTEDEKKYADGLIKRIRNSSDDIQKLFTINKDAQKLENNKIMTDVSDFKLALGGDRKSVNSQVIDYVRKKGFGEDEAVSVADKISTMCARIRAVYTNQSRYDKASSFWASSILKEDLESFRNRRIAELGTSRDKIKTSLTEKGFTASEITQLEDKSYNGKTFTDLQTQLSIFTEKDSLGALATQIKDTTKKIKESTDKIFELRPTVLGFDISSVGKADGGRITTSDKMKPKGTDIVPAMLTPGEFVVNARSTAENRELLERINSGEKVKSVEYLARGGKVGVVLGFAVDQLINMKNAAVDAKKNKRAQLAREKGLSVEELQVLPEDIFNNLYEQGRTIAYTNLLGLQKQIEANKRNISKDKRLTDGQKKERISEIENNYGKYIASALNPVLDKDAKIDYILSLPKQILATLKKNATTQSLQLSNLENMSPEDLKVFYSKTIYPFVTTQRKVFGNKLGQFNNAVKRNPNLLKDLSFANNKNLAENYLQEITNGFYPLPNQVQGLDLTKGSEDRKNLTSAIARLYKGATLPSQATTKEIGNLEKLPGVDKDVSAQRDLEKEISSLETQLVAAKDNYDKVASTKDWDAALVAQNKVDELKLRLQKARIQMNKLSRKDSVFGAKTGPEINPVNPKLNGPPVVADKPVVGVPQEAYSNRVTKEMFVESKPAPAPVVIGGPGGGTVVGPLSDADEILRDRARKEAAEKAKQAQVKPDVVSTTVAPGAVNSFGNSGTAIRPYGSDAEQYNKDATEAGLQSFYKNLYEQYVPKVAREVGIDEEKKRRDALEKKNFGAVGVDLNNKSIEGYDASGASYYNDKLYERKRVGYATGGFVPGSGYGDTVPAMLTPGEFVLNKSAVDKIGLATLHKANAQKFANGGSVRGGNNSGSGFNPVLNSEDFSKSILRFEASLSVLQTAFNAFNSSANALAQAMNKFPSSLTGTFSHTVNVNISGAEALAVLSPELEKIAVEKAKQVLSKYVKNNFPEAGIVE